MPEIGTYKLFREIDAHAERLKTFSGTAQLAIQAQGSGFHGALTLKAHLPDSLYAKVEGPFGIDLGLMQWHDDRFLFYSPFQQLAYTGHRDSISTRGMLPVPIEPSDFSRQVLGLLNVPESIRDSAIVSITEDRQYRLVFANGDRMFVRPDGPVVSRWEKLDDGGNVIWLWEADKFQKRGRVRLPRMVRLRTFEPVQQMTIYYEFVKTNKKLKPGWSDIRMPEDVLRLNL